MNRIATIFFLCALVGAQDTGPPTIRVTTRLVQISVVAQDKEGQPVGGLKKEDFTLLERGRAREIAVFSADFEDSQQGGSVELPPNVYSNRAFSRASHISVILVDGLNTKLADQVYARGQLLRFIRQIQRGDQVAIYVLNGSSVRVLHDFTDDPEHLARTIETYRASPSASLEAAQPGGAGSTELFDEIFALADKANVRIDSKIRARWTLEALEGIAHHLAALTGRKNLIWVSAGFPLSLGVEPGDSLYNETLRAARALTDANIAIYPVDARGLMVSPEFSADKSIPAYSAPRTAAAADQLTYIFSPPGHDTMAMLAERTGGRAFINRNDIDGAIRAAVNDARVTYTLGFYSPFEDWDGKFHDIKVKANRPGIELRYRTGFLAVADPVPNAKDLKAEVSSLLASALEATSIGLGARVRPQDPRAASKLSLTLQIPADEVSLSQHGGQWVASLELVFAQTGPDGRTLAMTEQPMRLSMTQPAYEDIVRHGMVFTKTVDLVAGAEILKIVVVDRSTGRVGSLRLPVKSKP